MKKYILLFVFLFATPVMANTTGYAWSESVGWFDFSNVTVTDTGLSGHAYNDNIGWLSFATGTNVTNDGGVLSGYAWSESVGWFDFGDISIVDWEFSGYAYNDNTGWLSFATGTNVTTTWTPATPAEPEQTTSRGRSGSRRRVVTPPTTPNAIPNVVAPNNPSSPNSIANNPRDLEYNMIGDDVRLLQQFLNQRGYIVNPNLGQPGSSGFETNYFGNLTRQAIIRFQQANGIKPSAGYFGPITRALIRTSIN